MSWSDPLVTVEPASEPITIEQARRQCGLTASDSSFDDDLTDHIKAARAFVEQYTGTPLVTRTISVQGDGFADLARLPVVPVQSVTSIGYVDREGADATVDASIYVLRGGRLEAVVALAPGNQWPATSGPITLTAVVGYEAVPDDVVHALKLIVAQYFSAREITRDGGWTWVDSLLCNHRVAL